MANHKNDYLKRKLALAFGAKPTKDELPTTPPVKARALAAAFGYLFPEEVSLLHELAKNMPEGGVYVNIGAGSGTSSLCVKETRPDAVSITVDISAGGPFGGMQNEVNAFTNADMIALLPEQLLGDSKQIGKDWDRGRIIDLLFIDGDHSYEGCKGDIESWLPHVKEGGVIAIHDYERDVWPDVKNATDEAAAAHGWSEVALQKTMIAFEV